MSPDEQSDEASQEEQLPPDPFYDPGDPDKVKRFEAEGQRLAILTVLAMMCACITIGAYGPKHVEHHIPPAPIDRLDPHDALADTHADAKPPSQGERVIPKTPEKWQKTKNCDPDLDEHFINGACYQRTGKRPPCGPKLRLYNGACYRTVAEVEAPATSIHEK